jgi:hypothetical protein
MIGAIHRTLPLPLIALQYKILTAEVNEEEALIWAREES